MTDEPINTNQQFDTDNTLKTDNTPQTQDKAFIPLMPLPNEDKNAELINNEEPSDKYVSQELFEAAQNKLIDAIKLTNENIQKLAESTNKPKQSYTNHQNDDRHSVLSRKIDVLYEMISEKDVASELDKFKSPEVRKLAEDYIKNAPVEKKLQYLKHYQSIVNPLMDLNNSGTSPTFSNQLYVKSQEEINKDTQTALKNKMAEFAGLKKKS